MIRDLSASIPLLAHADWGIGPRKRWVTKAHRTVDQHYQISSPQLLENPELYIKEFEAERKPGETCLLGFDFPIGLPLAYAQKAGILDFRVALLDFGSGKWMDFYHPAEKPDDIRIERPFYPLKPGNSKRAYLLEKLGIQQFDDLRRLCEKGYFYSDDQGIHRRRPASPLFWTMGSQQVGKAAILGWEHVLAPALRDPDTHLSLWPFDGNFDQILRAPGIIAVEAYPAEYYARLGIRFEKREHSGGKRSQAARIANTRSIIDWCDFQHIHLEADLYAWLREGFGSSQAGEDPFDSLVGLLGMISCIQNPTYLYEPQEKQIRQVEGWIFGMPGPNGSLSA